MVSSDHCLHFTTQAVNDEHFNSIRSLTLETISLEAPVIKRWFGNVTKVFLMEAPKNIIFVLKHLEAVAVALQ